ncbi:MAG: glucan biosynthesis protein C [Flavobacteriales bacterium]|jgi:glucan biosynthesis protein C
MKRNAFIDHIRIVLTALVILHHTAIVYGGGGSWYWVQEEQFTNLSLLFFNVVNQSFFMGFFFLFAGYYTPASFARKGIKRFWVERLQRLAVPLMAYFFIISPITKALARRSTDQPFWAELVNMVQWQEFEPGPLWFAEALLIFAALYSLWILIRPKSLKKLSISRIHHGWILCGALIIGLVTFLVRLLIPVGENWGFLQLGYFPPYVLLFIVGCALAQSKGLEKVQWREASPWALVSVLALGIMAVRFTDILTEGGILGGWHVNAGFYAMWDTFAAVGIILMMLWGFNKYWSSEHPLTVWIARRAFATYIVHPPVIVVLSMAAQSWAMSPLLKFGVVGTLSIIGSVFVASTLLAIPGVKKII